MSFLKRHIINMFTFAHKDLTENGDACIVWSGRPESPSLEERMVLNPDGTFNRLERRRNANEPWWLAKLQGNPKFHNEVLATVKRLGWDVNTIWQRPMGLHGTPEYSEEA